MKKKYAIFALLFTVLLLLSCATKKEIKVNYESYKIKKSSSDFTYQEAEDMALKAVSLVDYGPIVLSMSYENDGYHFEFFATELDKIFKVRVPRNSQDKNPSDATTTSNLLSYGYINVNDYYITPQTVIEMLLKDMKIEEFVKGYAYSIKMITYGGICAYVATFGDDKNEYKYIIDASVFDSRGILAKEIINKTK